MTSTIFSAYFARPLRSKKSLTSAARSGFFGAKKNLPVSIILLVEAKLDGWVWRVWRISRFFSSLFFCVKMLEMLDHQSIGNLQDFLLNISTVDSPTQCCWLPGWNHKKHTARQDGTRKKGCWVPWKDPFFEGIHLFHSKSFHNAKDFSKIPPSWSAYIIPQVPSAVCHLFWTLKQLGCPWNPSCCIHLGSGIHHFPLRRHGEKNTTTDRSKEPKMLRRQCKDTHLFGSGCLVLVVCQKTCWLSKWNKKNVKNSNPKFWHLQSIYFIKIFKVFFCERSNMPQSPRRKKKNPKNTLLKSTTRSSCCKVIALSWHHGIGGTMGPVTKSFL